MCTCFYRFFCGPIVCASVVIVAMAMFWHGVKIATCTCVFFSGTIVCASVVIVAMAMFDMELDKKNTQWWMY